MRVGLCVCDGIVGACLCAIVVTHPLPTSGLSITARSSMQFFFLVAAEAFTELECEGKEVPSLARESRTARGNNLNDAGLQGEYTNGYK